MSRFSACIAAVAVTLLFAACAAIPTKEQPAAYTQSFVRDAIRHYDRYGRQATIDYYSSKESLEGPWYVFVIGAEDGLTIAHYRPTSIGRDPALRVDSTGYFYGDDILRAPAEGTWVSYVRLNPETGEEERKHTWVVRHDGLIFGSGWYEQE